GSAPPAAASGPCLKAMHGWGRPLDDMTLESVNHLQLCDFAAKAPGVGIKFMTLGRKHTSLHAPGKSCGTPAQQRIRCVLGWYRDRRAYSGPEGLRISVFWIAVHGREIKFALPCVRQRNGCV